MSDDTKLPANQQRQLRKLVERVGENEALLRLQISRHTLARCLAGLPVRRGTLALVEQQLEQEQT